MAKHLSRMNRLHKFLNRRWADRLLLLEALGWLAWAKLLLLTLPFRWIAPRLGRQMAESPGSLTDAERPLVQRVGWAVQAVARHVPLGFVCLPQAMAAKWMLRRRSMPSTLYLGLRHEEKASMTAHAWLRAGDKIITGGAAVVEHRVIATFGE
jgi:hypothetical protein